MFVAHPTAQYGQRLCVTVAPLIRGCLSSVFRLKGCGGRWGEGTFDPNRGSLNMGLPFVRIPIYRCRGYPHIAQIRKPFIYLLIARPTRNLTAFEKEFTDTGKFADDSYAIQRTLGISRAMVDQYTAGVVPCRPKRFCSEVFGSVGTAPDSSLPLSPSPLSLINFAPPRTTTLSCLVTSFFPQLHGN